MADKNPQTDYPFIVAYQKWMGANEWYISQQVKRARETGAPANATSWDSDRGAWRTTDGILNPQLRAYLELPDTPEVVAGQLASDLNSAYLALIRIRARLVKLAEPGNEVGNEALKDGRVCEAIAGVKEVASTLYEALTPMAGSEDDPYNPLHEVGFGDGGYIIQNLAGNYTVTFYGESDPQSEGIDWPTAVKVLAARITEFHNAPGYRDVIVPCWRFNADTGEETPFTVHDLMAVYSRNELATALAYKQAHAKEGN